jgi:hypothetical protein
MLRLPLLPLVLTRAQGSALLPDTETCLARPAMARPSGPDRPPGTPANPGGGGGGAAAAAASVPERLLFPCCPARAHVNCRGGGCTGAGAGAGAGACSGYSPPPLHSASCWCPVIGRAPPNHTGPIGRSVGRSVGRCSYERPRTLLRVLVRFVRGRKRLRSEREKRVVPFRFRQSPSGWGDRQACASRCSGLTGRYPAGPLDPVTPGSGRGQNGSLSHHVSIGC